MTATINIALFLIFQIGTALFFKWASNSPQHYWLGFIIGNTFGLFSTFAYVNVFKVLNPNLAVATCSGGAFLVVQIALFLIYKENATWFSAIGAFLIVTGIAVMCMNHQNTL